ncbi:T6SS immunity protein Tli4 family protein [Massilia norwichensis]|uniref:T6SS immunity protein Tli4 family protein n=1 Tax=Massilia norwichensis TaxID=1442366 RepID=A0ABT2A1C9_9BURK|nr:T6SS immunity protein Tli4 family protein [Massilia norwichensis]MCS0587670.1 T6SS immunity protein Tli4 family protein [Massilia norwichensis]
MKRIFQSKLFRVYAAMAGCLAAAWAAGAAWDTFKVVQMTGKMTTVCVGRMLIDLPAETRVELYGAEISGLGIDAFAESSEAFQQRLAAREAEIRAKPDFRGGRNNMESASDVRTDNGLAGKIFVHGRNVTEGNASDGFTTEHFHYEGVAIEAHVHGGGISIDLSADDYDPKLIGNLPRLLAQLVPNPANRAPTEPGFCLDRAYVRDPLPADENEQITLAAELPSYPDLGFHFETTAGLKPDPRGLIERNAASRGRLPAILNMRVTDLRAAPRTIGGLKGEEVVQRVIEDNLAIVYGFEWEVNGIQNTVYVPTLRLTMVTGRDRGEPVASSLSQPAALALWDRISSSIRVRPVSR